jgi:hypothetical protein
LSEVACSFEDTLDALIDGMNVMPCGDLGFKAATQEAEEPQRCALDAFAEGRPFVVTCTPEGADSQLANAYVWDGETGVQFVDYDSDPSGAGKERPKVTLFECESFGEKSGCAPNSEDLCLECPVRNPDIVCEWTTE